MDACFAASGFAETTAKILVEPLLEESDKRERIRLTEPSTRDLPFLHETFFLVHQTTAPQNN